MRLAILGNVNFDLVFQVDRLPERHEKMGATSVTIGGGGAPANVAWWLAQLGHEVHYFAALGDDPLSEVALASLSDVGVNTSAVRRVPGIGPTLAVMLANGSDKRMIGGRAGDKAQAGEAIRALIAETDFGGVRHLHTVAWTHPMLFANGRRADLDGVPVSADLNGGYSARIAGDLDLIFSNRDEVVRKTGQKDPGAMIARDMAEHRYGAVITNGAQDVTVYRPEGPVSVVPDPVAVIDRTGAGDGFCAGYLHGTWAGLPPEEAIRAGLRLAAAVMSGHGCRPVTKVSRAALEHLRGL